MVIRKTYILLPLLFASSIVSGQTDYNWWNKKHNWDGVTHWTNYIVLSPARLGPNALPVPDFYSGKICSQHRFEAGTEGHYSKGDQTANLYLDYQFPLYSDRATLQVTYRPIEAYQTDTITRDFRRSREEDGAGISYGDVYVSTNIQLIREHEFLPDLMLSANIKTASGSNLDGARHTDTPGYWFDATAGKKLNPGNHLLHSVRIYAKAGFYVYQTYMVNHYQNDAFLYGAGVMLAFRKITVHNQLTGYSGYFKNGDSPLVYRLIVESSNEKKVQYRAMFQQGIRDFNFSTLRISALVNLNSKYLTK